MPLVNIAAVAVFLAAFVAVALYLRRLGVRAWGLPVLAFAVCCWAILSGNGSAPFATHVVAFWLMGLRDFWLAFALVAVFGPVFEELSRFVLLLLVLAYRGERGWSTWRLGMTIGLTWGLAELFFKTLGFALPLVGITPMAFLAQIAHVQVMPEQAPFMLGGRLLVVPWHGAITVMMLHGLRTSRAGFVIAAFGLHAAANASGMVTHFLDPSLVANFASALAFAILFWVLARRVAGQGARSGTAPAPARAPGEPLPAP